MASWSDAKINMMDEKADKEVDEMLFQFAFLLYDTIIIEKFPQALLEYEKHQRHGVKNT